MSATAGPVRDAEATRQRRLVAALRAGSADVAGAAAALGVRGPAPQTLRALQAYRANAAALAERALGAAYPTVAALVGEQALAAIARRLWHAQPPRRGDLAHWGEALPAALAGDPALADEPYLADVARVDWAVHVAESAADAAPDPASLARLADGDPAALRLVLAPGAALVPSPHPVATVWRAHRDDGPDRFAPVRAAFAAGTAETAFVWRAGWRADVVAVDVRECAFAAALCEGASLDAALDAADPDFDFTRWLTAALSAGQVVGVASIDGGDDDDPRS